MDDSIEIIKNFEDILCKNVKREPLALYSKGSKTNSPGFQGQTSNSVQDVISKVCRQIKAIQKADAPNTSRKDRMKLDKFKKSLFLPVNMLPRDVEVPLKTPASKFETQLVSDTQLINLADNAEALVNNNGITQEFDCPFSQTDLEEVANDDEKKIVSKENTTVLSCDNGSSSETEIINQYVNSSSIVGKENNDPETRKTVSIKTVDGHKSNIHQDKLLDIDNSQLNNNCTKNLNQCIEIETDLNELDIVEVDDVEIQPSLVFVAKKSKTPSPLVFDLYRFEDFEKIAIPIIEENTDIKSAKQLINFQILGKELIIQTNIPHAVSPTKEQLSPVLKISSERLKITKTEYSKLDLNEHNNEDVILNEVNKENDDTFLKDEILFSSDEENEYLHKEFQDIPLTCALETSFYEQPDMLDKTMYVGFQTASNRSIQISRESFSKAQSLLDKAEKDVSSKVSLTDLVESLSVNKTSSIGKTDFDTMQTRCKLEEIDSDDLVQKEIDHLKRPDKRKFEGFITASRKKIKLSDMALARCKKVFQNIDIDANYDMENDAEVKRLISDNIQENFTVESYYKNAEESKQNTCADKLEINSQIDDDILQEFDNDMSLVSDKNLENELENCNTKGNYIKQAEIKMLTTKKFFDTIDFSDSILVDDQCEITEKSSLRNDNNINIDNPLETKSEFMGFKTASNNQIPISSKGLERAKNLFQDINVCEDDNTNLNSAEIKDCPGLIECVDTPPTIKFDGFKTASNKAITVSNEALVRSKSILQDIITNVSESEHRSQMNNEQDGTDISVKKISDQILDSNSEHNNVKELDDDLNEVFNSELLEIEKKHTSEPCGFKTASNKPVIISEKALAQSKLVFQDLGIDDDLKCDNERLGEFPAMLKKCKTDVVMKSHSDKPSVESKSFGNNRNTDNIATINEINMNPLCFANFDIRNSAMGFRTASSKPINISDAALAKTHKIFKDIENENTDFIKIKEKVNEKFKGFTTGNNNPITISAQALAKSKEIFKDIDDSIKDFNIKQTSGINSFKGFQTASNKLIEVSDKALAESKALFKDIDDDDIFNTNFGDDSVRPLAGFQTASKKPVVISSHALAKSKEILKHIDKDAEIQNDYLNEPIAIFDKAIEDSENDSVENHITEIKGKIPKFMGFQTASKKTVTVSSEAIARSKALFKDIDKDMPERDSTKSIVDLEFMGFQTASNKPVQISAEALAKSKDLFKDVNKKVENIFDENNLKKLNDLECKSFQTASDKPVEISKEILAKSKALCKDGNKTSIFEIDNREKHYVPKFVGFETASKKPVKISEEALAKSKALFKDIDQDIVDKHIESKQDSAVKFKDFETASKKPVKISEEALAKSKALFKDIDQDIVDKHIESKQDSVVKFKGFQTASKKSVDVSEKALAESKELFTDIDNETSLNRNLAKLTPFLGFHTASHKSVDVSKEALAKSKRIFDEVDGFKEEDKSILFKGFETASNKKVKISEEALKKSRQIFQDINLKDDKENFSTKDNILQSKATSFGFQTGNKIEIKISEQALKDSRRLLKVPENVINKSKTETNSLKVDNNIIEKLIDTQVINNFEESLNTEDFTKETTPKQCKRSGSPILSCPKAKRRKFNTPYTKNKKTPTINPKITPKHDDITIFNDDYKKSKRYTLKDLDKVEAATSKFNPDPYILNFNIDNLLNFEFDGQRNGITDGKFSINDLKEYFLRIVNKKLVPTGWLDIQLKLILWKLISYEMKFTQTLNRVCTARNVIEQLKYRYDKELYNVERPVLRKILEKDDSASKTMILCVAGIFVDGVNVDRVTNITSNVELLLTDGWYFVKAVIDKMLTKLVYEERITVGCKLVINGAELMNCEQGIAPWEDTSSVRLKIFGNSTRKARWDARLGRHGNGAILTALSSVKPEGGKVSKLRLYVTRVYPMLYVEKFEDGSTVTRSERLENIHQIKYEADRQSAMEKLYEEVEKELSDQESQESDGSQMKNKKHYESMITESQTKSLEEKSNRKREKLLQNIQERVRKKVEDKGLNVARNVVTLLKIRVAGVEEKGGVVVTKGFMSIWKPNDMLTEIIKEDSWIEVMNVVPTAIRYSEIHLSAGRQTIFKPSKFQENDRLKPYLKTLARNCLPVGALAQNPTMTTEYNEVDTVGFIFQIDEDSPQQPFQNMYLSDGENNIICVNFWGGLRKFGFQNVLDTGQIISCTNLQKRAGNTRKSIPQFRVTEFTFFTKTPKNMAARNMIAEIEKKISGLDKKKYCDDCVNIKNNYSNRCFVENVSPYRYNDLNLTKNKMFIDSPLVAKREENIINLTGLDFESTFRQTDTQELSPKSKERKKKVNEKIARLKMIGEPPPLSPMNIINKSKNAFNSYKSPLAQTSVAITNKSAEISVNNIQSSPIIQMNRTYVKNVNPVKLNFSNVQENSFDEKDHFAEEFDGSPPLSLE